ncbi:hypothetical protein ACIBF6_02935 [Streptosporangium amethystogenes]
MTAETSMTELPITDLETVLTTTRAVRRRFVDGWDQPPVGA